MMDGGSGWWLRIKETAAATFPPSNGTLAQIIRNQAGAAISRVLGDHSNKTSFDQWFFSSDSPESHIYLLAAFLVLLLLGCFLTMPVLFVIIFKSRTASNVVILHLYIANFLVMISFFIRFIYVQMGKKAYCGGAPLYMALVGTPVAHISLTLLTLERFVFHVGHNYLFLRHFRSIPVLTFIMLTVWFLMGALLIGLFLLMRMITLADFLRPTLSSSGCSPLHTLSPIKDVLLALFSGLFVIPLIATIIMQLIINVVTCRSRHSIFQRTTALALYLILAHVPLSLPYIILSLFIPKNFPLLGWMLVLRMLDMVLALFAFIALDPYTYTLLITLIFRRKRQLSSNMNVGDIDTLIASVDVSPKSLLQADNISAATTSTHKEHPYLAIKPARLYFERPQDIPPRPHPHPHHKTLDSKTLPTPPKRQINPPPLPPRKKSLPPSCDSSKHFADYRLSLCDERLIKVESRASPGGWFECVITNEDEV